jgi:hypothetical protein
MVRSQTDNLVRYVGDAGYAAAELEAAADRLRATEDAAAAATRDALQESVIAVGILRQQREALRTNAAAMLSCDQQYEQTPEGRAIQQGRRTLRTLTTAARLPETESVDVPCPIPSQQHWLWNDQQWKEISQLARQTNDMIGSMRADYDANETDPDSATYAATARPLREVLHAAATIRDAIDHLADLRLTYLRRAHSAHLVRHVRGQRLLRTRVSLEDNTASGGGPEEISQFLDPQALRVLVGPSAHGGGWAVATMDISGAFYNLEAVVCPLHLHDGFLNPNNLD